MFELYGSTHERNAFINNYNASTIIQEVKKDFIK